MQPMETFGNINLLIVKFEKKLRKFRKRFGKFRINLAETRKENLNTYRSEIGERSFTKTLKKF